MDFFLLVIRRVMGQCFHFRKKSLEAEKRTDWQGAILNHREGMRQGKSKKSEEGSERSWAEFSDPRISNTSYFPKTYKGESLCVSKGVDGIIEQNIPMKLGSNHGLCSLLVVQPRTTDLLHASEAHVDHVYIINYTPTPYRVGRRRR